MMGKYRATASVAPQFAYNLCVRKADPDELAGVDLSPLRVLLNGAEPVDAAGVAAFQQRFRSLGLRPGVVTPCYGLSEGTLAATMRSPGQRVRTMAIPTSARNGNRPSDEGGVCRTADERHRGAHPQPARRVAGGRTGWRSLPARPVGEQRPSRN